MHDAYANHNHSGISAQLCNTIKPESACMARVLRRTSYVVHVQVPRTICLHHWLGQGLIGVQEPCIVVLDEVVIVLIRP